MNFFASLVKGAGLRWRPLHKVQKHRPNRQVRRWVQLVALGGIMKKSLDIESKLFLALFVFCSGAVPSYSSHSQNTKFISLSQSLTACSYNVFASSSHFDKASSSGASLQIMLSKIRLAPIFLQSSSHWRIHSPPPQP